MQMASAVIGARGEFISSDLARARSAVPKPSVKPGIDRSRQHMQLSSAMLPTPQSCAGRLRCAAPRTARLARALHQGSAEDRCVGRLTFNDSRMKAGAPKLKPSPHGQRIDLRARRRWRDSDRRRFSYCDPPSICSHKNPRSPDGHSRSSKPERWPFDLAICFNRRHQMTRK